MNKIIIIDSYANTAEKVNILRRCINCFKRKNYDVMVVSHIFVPEDVLNLVDYYIFDKNNSFNDRNKSLFWWARFPGYDLDVNLVPPVFQSKGHEYPIMRSMKNALSLAAENKYDLFCFTEFDNFYEDDELDKIDEMFRNLESSKNSFFLFTGKDPESYDYFETIFFCGNVYSALVTLNSYFPYDLNSFNEKFLNRYPYSLEHFFYDMLQPNKNNLSIIESRFVNYFNKSTKNMSSMLDVISFILSDHNGNYYIIVANNNQQNATAKIKLQDKVIHENTFSSLIYPATKLETEGDYLVEFFAEDGSLHKSYKLDFYHESKQKYIKQGKATIKT